MKNIKELCKLGFSLTWLCGGRIIYVKDAAGNKVCSIFFGSGACVVETGTTFECLNEVKAAIKANKKEFFKIQK